METKQHIYFNSAKNISFLPSESIDLMVTSPPYPMIEMWDSSFGLQNPAIGQAFEEEAGEKAFSLMHELLDQVWAECYRLLKPGSFACINIGDAVRTVGGNFCLYPNHARIIDYCRTLGFQALPLILWRKQTNSPNKFMGSGMLPAGAYVTLEHEYILILRKGSKRSFSPEVAAERRKSALFWEERNLWFSDLWDFKGTRQKSDASSPRSRSGAFPLELAFRLINMYSLQGDWVLDPFLGTGTTLTAAASSGRNGIGVELEKDLEPSIADSLQQALSWGVNRQHERLENHKTFIQEYLERKGKEAKHYNNHYQFPVITGQEKDLQLPIPDTIIKDVISREGGADLSYKVAYSF